MASTPLLYHRKVGIGHLKTSGGISRHRWTRASANVYEKASFVCQFKSFDFTGEIRMLNKLCTSDWCSFVEQLENAFRTPGGLI